MNKLEMRSKYWNIKSVDFNRHHACSLSNTRNPRIYKALFFCAEILSSKSSSFLQEIWFPNDYYSLPKLYNLGNYKNSLILLKIMEKKSYKKLQPIFSLNSTNRKVKYFSLVFNYIDIWEQVSQNISFSKNTLFSKKLLFMY